MNGLRLAAAVLFASIPVAAIAIEPVVAPGEELETRLDADFDGDAAPDVAYITRTDEKRNLHIAYSIGSAEYLPLDTTPFGAATLKLANGVLVFEDLTGGTTAYATTRRYRYDPAELRMRLIGFDSTHYSRTYAHDGFELSWNLLTGRLVTRELHLNRKGGDAAYDPIVEKTTRRRAGKVWLFDTPDPEELIREVSGR